MVNLNGSAALVPHDTYASQEKGRCSSQCLAEAILKQI